jgi:ABC-type antimicrobial peptide transport system permease subunit
MPFLVIGVLGIFSCLTFGYALYLAYDARRQIIELWRQKQKQYPKETQDIAPVTLLAGRAFRFESRLLLPWLSMPWAIIAVWVIILVVGLILKHGNTGS